MSDQKSTAVPEERPTGGFDGAVSIWGLTHKQEQQCARRHRSEDSGVIVLWGSGERASSLRYPSR